MVGGQSEDERQTTRIERESGARTPFLVRAKVMSEMGPYAGSASHSDRCTTDRLRTRVEDPFVVPFAGSSSSLDDPYRSSIRR